MKSDQDDSEIRLDLCAIYVLIGYQSYQNSKRVCEQTQLSLRALAESCRKWRRGNTGRENMAMSAICNTAYGRWTHHKAQREVAITHPVVGAMFPLVRAGQPAQRPGS